MHVVKSMRGLEPMYGLGFIHILKCMVGVSVLTYVRVHARCIVLGVG